MEREEFLKDIEKYREAGVLKEIFNTDDFSICNISNQCYAIFSYYKSELGQCGILMSPDRIREIISSPELFAIIVSKMDKEHIRKMTLILNEKNFNVMLDMKKKTDTNGPSPDIDVELEAELLGREKNK